MAYAAYKSIRGDLETTPGAPTVTPTAAPATTPSVAMPRLNTTPRVANNPAPATVVPTQYPRGKYMTGSTVQKLFDVLQTPQYAVAAFSRGGLKSQQNLVQGRASHKSEPGDIVKNIVGGFKYIPQGIQERSSFADYAKEIGVKNPVAQAGLGLVGDIALDPTTYLGFGLLGDGLKGAAKITKLDKAGTAIKDLPLVKNIIDNLGEKFIYRYKQPASYVARAEKLTKDIALGNEEALKIGSSLKYAPQDITVAGTLYKKGTELPVAVQQRLAQLIRGGVTEDQALAKLSTPAVEKFKNLAQQQVQLGTAPEETFQKYFGQYLPTYYKKFLESKGMGTGNKLATERFMAKGSLEDLGKSYLQGHGESAAAIAQRSKSELEMLGKKFQSEMGMIKEAAYPAARGIAEESKNVALTKYFDYVDKQVAKDFAEPGFVKLSDSKRLGNLAGKYVPKYVRDEISSMGVLPATEDALSGIKKGTEKFISQYWKPGKTVLNPGQQVRNFLSNFILNDLVGGTGTWKTLPGAIKEIRSNGKFYQEAKNSGLFSNTFVRSELDNLLGDLEKLPTDSPGKILKGVQNVWRKAINKGSDIQQSSEELGKLMQFMYQRQQGKTVQEAANLAEKALFNYQKITPFEKGLRKSLIPFYTFTRKSVPLVAETALNHPGRLSKYRKTEQAIENLTPQREGERRLLPNWMKDQVRIPGSKNRYLSTSYIYPWGNTFSDSYLPFGLNIPGLDLASKGLFGYDPYFKQKLPTESSPLKQERVMGRVNAILRTLEPTVGTAAIEKLIPAILNKPDYIGRTRSVPEVLIGDIFGLKSYPFDVSKANENQQKAIKAISTNTTTEINRTIKDQSLGPEEKARRIRLLILQRNKDTLKLLKGE